MARDKAIHAFYTSKAWRLLRLSLIAERGNRCQRCGKIIPRACDIIGHHIIELTPENMHDHRISLNPDLIELIDFDCHNEEHKRFGHHNKKEVFIVYGPPCSGKREFVSQNMMRGDLMVELDALYEAMSGLPRYDKPDRLFSNVIGVHNQLLDNIKTRHGKWGSAWVIGGYPDKYKRERLAEDLGAELVYCEASREECLARVAIEIPQYKEAYTDYVNKWFEQHS